MLDSLQRCVIVYGSQQKCCMQVIPLPLSYFSRWYFPDGCSVAHFKANKRHIIIEVSFPHTQFPLHMHILSMTPYTSICIWAKPLHANVLNGWLPHFISNDHDLQINCFGETEHRCNTIILIRYGLPSMDITQEEIQRWTCEKQQRDN